MTSECPPLLLPLRFGAVEEGVFRCAYPTLRGMRFLRRLRLRTVLCLSTEPPTADLEAFCAAEGAELLHVRTTKYDENASPLAPAALVAALEAMVRPEKHPLLVHCLDGRHATGLAVAALRKLQMWAFSAAAAEFQLYAGEQPEGGLLRALDSFAGPLNVPSEPPPWLWPPTGLADRHPTVSVTVDGRPLSPDPEVEDERRKREEENQARRAGLERSRKHRGLASILVADDRAIRAYERPQPHLAAPDRPQPRRPDQAAAAGLSAGARALALESAADAVRQQKRVAEIEAAWT